MESSGSRRSRLLKAGGVLSIIAGTYEVIGGAGLVALVVSPTVLQTLLYPLVLAIWPPLWPIVPTWLIIVGVALFLSGGMAMVGGVSALKRKRFGLSLAGAICALPSVVFGLSLAGAIPGLSSVIRDLRLAGTFFCTLPTGVLGVMGVIFVALAKRELNGADSGMELG